MKTIKGSINYSLFCFSDIHSFNFNFTLTVLMFNLGNKELYLGAQGRVNSPDDAWSGRRRGSGEAAKGRDRSHVHRCQAVTGEVRSPKLAFACEKSLIPFLDPVQDAVKAINKHRLC